MEFTMTEGRSYGNLILLFTAAIWGVAFVPQRVAMSYIDPHWFNALRFSLGALLLYLLVPHRRQFFTRALFFRALPLSACLYSGALLQQMALVSISAAKAGFVTSLYFVLVPFVELYIFKSQVRFLQWVAVSCSVIGVTLLCGTDGQGFTLSDGILVLCTLPYALHVVFASRIPAACDAYGVAFHQYLFCGLFGLIVSCGVSPAPLFWWPTNLWLAFIYCSLFSVVIGYTLQIIGQKQTTSVEAALAFSMESVFAALAGVVLLHEVLGEYQMIGCVFMLTAVILVQLPQRRPRAPLSVGS